MLGNLILETCNAPGTAADCNLLGATSGRLPFSFWFTSGTQCFYCMSDGSQMEWGIGTFTAGSPNKLNRTIVLKNSANSTARLNFLGTTNVYNETPAERELWVDNNGNVSVPGSMVAGGFNAYKAGGAVMTLTDPSAAVNAKYWDFLSQAGNFVGRAVNDVYNAATNWLTVTRSGTTVTGITLAATNLALNGATVVNGSLNITGAFTFAQSVNTANGITAGYLQSTGDMNVARNFAAGNNVWCVSLNTGTLNVSGNAGIVGNLGAAYLNSSGSVDGGYLYSRGDGSAAGTFTAANLTANNALNVGGTANISGILTTGTRIRIGVGDNGFQANTHNYYVTINGSIEFAYAANFIVSGGGRGAYGFEWYWGTGRIAEMDTGGSLSLRGNITTGNTGYFGALQSSTGLFQVGPGYYLQRGGDGHWRFVEANTENFRVGTDGNIYPRSGLITQNLLLYGDSDCRGRAYAADQNMWMGYGGNGRVMQFNPGAYWEWGGDWALQYYRADRGPHFIMRNDGWVENRLGGGGGQDLWYRISDIRTKENVVRATAGLAEILQLKPIRYTRIKRAIGDETNEHRIPQVGFSAQQIRPFIPEAVRAFPDSDKPDDPEPLLAVADGPIVAALVNAFRELHDLLNETREQLGVATRRIIQLESRAAASPAT
jgi:hypothetical protein